MTITISKDVLAQELDGETVLLDLSGERFFGLDEVSTRIWQLLGEGADEAAIVDRLLEEYDVGRGVLEQDVSGLLAQLTEAGLIERG